MADSHPMCSLSHEHFIFTRRQNLNPKECISNEAAQRSRQTKGEIMWIKRFPRVPETVPLVNSAALTCAINFPHI